MIINKRNSITAVGIFCATGLVLLGQSAYASVSYNTTIPIISGNPLNTGSGWTTATENGISLSLRAQSTDTGDTANTSGIYSYPATVAANVNTTGTFNWDYWFDVNPGSATVGSYALTVTSSLGGVATSYSPITSFLTDNGVSGTEFQNAENLSFVFPGQPGYDPTLDATYYITLTAYGTTPGSQTSGILDQVNITVNNGTPTASVPEPSTYAAAGLMLLPFGLAGLKAIRRKRSA